MSSEEDIEAISNEEDEEDNTEPSDSDSDSNSILSEDNYRCSARGREPNEADKKSK